MTGFTALYDANVLVAGSVRDLLLELASRSLFRARVSQDILRELRTTLSGRFQHEHTAIDHLFSQMFNNALDPVVSGYGVTQEGLRLPDDHDRHVLAAAIHAGAGAIVTYNTRDFPAEALRPYGIEAQHPDVFVANLLALHPADVVNAVRAILKRLKEPPVSAEKLLLTYEKNQLFKVSEGLRPFLLSERL